MKDRRGTPTVRWVLAIGIGITASLAAVSFAGVIAVFAPAELTVDALLAALAVLAMAVVGTVLAIRVPANAVGWLLLVAAFLLGIEFLALVYGEASRVVGAGSWPGADVAMWLYGNLLVLPVLILAVGIPLIFPDGRLLSPRWRWLAAIVVLTGAEIVLTWFRPGLIPDTTVQNPFGIAGIDPWLDVLTLPPFQLAGPVAFVGAVASVVVRFRRGGVVERAQLKWLVAATSLAVVAWPLIGLGTAIGATMVTTLAWYTGLLSFIAFPLAIGIAVLRYRLYEIDRIISRSIAWAMVTGVLVAAFAGGVLAFQTALAGLTQGETLAVAASTLIAFALFQPVRRRVQRVVDRRFDRARYDAERTVHAFAERIRDGAAVDAVLADLQATVTDSIKPSSSALWLRPRRSRLRSAGPVTTPEARSEARAIAPFGRDS
jgi:hypothetical protein